MPSEVPAVASSVRILETLAAEWPAAVSPGRLVSELGLNRSTCYNILGTLQSMGWAANMGDRAGWTLGPRLLSLTGVNTTLSAVVVQDALNELSRELALVVFAAERDGSGGYIVTAKGERRTGVRVTIGIGDRFPFSAPAIMQAFEAWAPFDQFEGRVRRHSLQKFTEHTVTDLDELKKVFARVRRIGYSQSLREYDLAQGAVATPVFDGRGRVNLVLTTIAFSSELNENTVAEFGARLRDGAERLMQRIGGTRPALADDVEDDLETTPA
ncbi:IclR family transcriptional regulator [Micromonospora sicca]|nr:IclR family transcriptional regulator [Micromonospora sp. 4G51]